MVDVKVLAALLAAVLAACATPGAGQHSPAWVADTTSYGPVPVLAAAVAPAPDAGYAAHRVIVERILAAGRADRAAYTRLAQLTDRIGHRMSGSAALDRAIAWAADAMTADGLTVHTEPVRVPHWVRGAESAALVAPIARPLAVIGLGGSVPTPTGGVTARVVVVRSFDELEARAAEVKGALVLYDVPLTPWTDTPSNYGTVAAYRINGPSRAAKLGAVGVLMRSVTAHSLDTLHTGAIAYDPAQPKLPAAAVTVEDAALIARLAAQGPVTVKLALASRRLPDAASANVIGELRGREHPEQVVVLGAHLDTWDVGQGAHDDGAGCVVMMRALALLRELGLQPRRTIRVVLFTAEELEIRGGKAYAAAHAAELGDHVFAIESDVGGYRPIGLGYKVAAPAAAAPLRARLEALTALLASTGLRALVPEFAGADVAPMVPAGVPALALIGDARTYFDVHHSAADTFDKIDPVQLAEQVAAVAALAYVIAEDPVRIDGRAGGVDGAATTTP